MGKQIFFDSEGRRQLEGGIRTLAKAVRVTFGPTGRNVILEKRFGPSSVVKDGVTVAREIEIEQPFENMGAKLLNEVATKTNKEVGDGTTTSVILAEEMISRGRKFVDSGVSPIALRTGMRKAAERAVVALQEMATPIKGRKSIEQVGRIAANNDALLGKLFADALDEVGPKGVVTVEEGTGVDSILELVDGMEIDKGYISPYFINQREEMVCRLERPMILITDRKISSIHDLVPILEKVLVTQRPLLLIAEDVEGEALAGLIINHLRGVLQAAAVKAPAFGDRRKAILEDLAVMTGGEFLSKDLGFEWESVEPSRLGSASKVEITKDKTIIYQGVGAKADIGRRCRQIEAQMEQTTSSYDREKLEERLAKLSGSIAVVKVGAHTETEMKERKARAEDALSATRAAMEEGVVAGGCTAFIRAIPPAEAARVTGDERFGVQVVAEALRAPLQQLGENLGVDGPAVTAEVEEAAGNRGFDATRNRITDLVKAGIIDSAKVLRVALQNAVSVASMNLASDTVITEVPKDKEAVTGAIT